MSPLPLKLLHLFLRVPSHVADGHPALLGPVMDLFHQVLAALLGERRERQPDHLAVVGRGDPEVARLDRLLDRADGALVERRDREEPRLGDGDATRAG